MNLTNRLLTKATKLAYETSDIQRKLTLAFNERYGATYSDVDEDWLIDSLDYGNGPIPTIEDCDRVMTEAGYPPLA